MKIRTFILLGIIAAMLLSACGNQTPTSLEGSSWILVEINGQPVLADPLVTLSFKDGQLGGTDGCNHYGGSYTAQGSQLTIGKDIFSTMMACEEDIMQQASAYITALTNALQYKISGKSLKLIDGNGAVLAVFNAQSQDLAGTSWIVTGFNNGAEAVVSPLLDTEIILSFDADGKLNGKACNGFFGSYETAGGTLNISQMGRTEMFCVEPQGIMEQEDQFLAALASAATYQVDSNHLEMRTAGDEIAVSLTKAP